MASLYDNTSNIYRTDFKSVPITDSGTFSLPAGTAKQVQIFNDHTQVIRIYKTSNVELNATISGTSNCTGVFLEIEDGNSYDINGVGNAQEISIQKKLHTAVPLTFDLKYVISK